MSQFLKKFALSEANKTLYRKYDIFIRLFYVILSVFDFVLQEILPHDKH